MEYRFNYPRLEHPNCGISKCGTCLANHIELGKYLDHRCHTNNRIDHLGKYHKWLSDIGIQPETEWGWATPEAFDPENIESYIKWFMS